MRCKAKFNLGTVSNFEIELHFFSKVEILNFNDNSKLFRRIFVNVIETTYRNTIFANLVFLMACEEVTKIFRHRLLPAFHSRVKYNADGDLESSQITFQRDIDVYKSVTWTFKRPTNKFFASSKSNVRNLSEVEAQVSAKYMK